MAKDHSSVGSNPTESTIMEKIVAAAIKFNMREDPYPSVWLGKRHADILHKMMLHQIEYDRTSAVQGFWTSNNRFVDRYEAKIVAVQANQLIVPIEKTFSKLFSEDVW